MNDTTKFSTNKVGGPVPVPEILSLLEAPSIFNRAKFLRPGPVLHHLPLIFWMVEALRPSRIVTLGGSDGVVHFAMCQAVERLGLASTCVCYADWPNGTVPEDIANYDDQQYQEFSELVAISPVAAAEQVKAGSVDLIVIDQPVDDSLNWLIEAGWLDRLSDRSIIMIHRARKDNLPEILRGAPIFDFPHGSGMVVSGGGTSLPARLDKLFNVSQHALQSQALLHVFRRLGFGQAAEGEVRSEAVRRTDAEERASEAENQLVILGLELTKMRNLLETRETAIQELGKANAKLKKMHLEVEQAEVETVRLRQDVKNRDAKNDTLVQQLQQTKDQLSKAEAAHQHEETIRRELDGASAERASEAESQLVMLELELTKMRNLLEARETEIQELGKANAKLKKMHLEIEQAEVETVRLRQDVKNRDAKNDTLVQQLQQTKDQLSKAEAAHQHEETIRRELDAARKEADNARAEAEELRSKIDAIRTEVEIVRREQEELTCEGASAAAIARDLQSERDQMAKDLVGLSRRLWQAEAEMAAMAEKIAAITVKNINTNAEMDRLKIHLKAVEQARNDILMSTSWRVTSPMRFVSGKLKL